MRPGLHLKDKCEVVGQGLFAWPNACHLNTVTCVCDRAMAGHCNADIKMPGHGPAAVSHFPQLGGRLTLVLQ